MEKQKLVGVVRRKSRKEEGFTLLEYAGGAAVLAGLVFLGFRVFGQSLDSLYQGLAAWTNERTETIQGATNTDERGAGPGNATH